MGRRSLFLYPLILALALSAGAQEGGVPWNPAPGRYSYTRVSLNLPPGGAAEYRFVENGDGIWRPWTAAIELQAFPREERVYRIQVRSQRGGERVEGEALYVIDRLPPAAPTVHPQSGSYEGPVALQISAEAGAVIFYSLEARDRPSGGFRVYDPEDPPRIDRPRDGTRAWTLSAYAVDSSGTPGPVLTARYSVEPDPAGAYAPVNAEAGRSVLAEGAAIEYSAESRTPGTVRLAFPASGERRLFAAVGPPDPRDGRYYTELPQVSGKAQMELSAPPGWTGPLVVRCAALEAGELRLAPEPLEVSFTYGDPTEAPPEPPEPRVVSPSGTRTVLLSWDPFPFRIEFSVGEGAFTPYAAPVPVMVPEGSEGLVVRYRSVGPNGAASSVRSVNLAPTRQTGLPEIAGFPSGGVTNQGVRPRALLGTVVRYEASEEGLPKPVTGASPLLGEDVVFPGEEGKETSYTLRLRAFSDSTPEASGSDERFVSFVVDRLPPSPPRLAAGSLEGEEEDDRLVAFEPGEGTVLFAVAEKGAAGEPEYRTYEGPVRLEGSGERPRAYEVYAYALDAAGNKSGVMGPIAVRIDRASVYVASWGSDSAGGGPRNPLASLSAGVDAAVRAGKRFVRVQGDVPLGEPLRPGASVEILGGCDETWETVSDSRSRIDVSGGECPYFLVYGTGIVLRNLSITAERRRDLAFAEVREGSLEASGLDLSLSAPGELAVVQAENSRVSLADTSIRLSGALFARVVDSRGGETRITGLRLRAERAVGYLTAFSFREGTAEIHGMRSETLTSGGFTLVRGVGSRTDLRNTYVKARGSGYCEAFRLEAGQAVIYLASMDLECEGRISFASLEGAQGDILHSTVSLSSGRTIFLNLKDSRVRLGNCVLLDVIGEGILIRADQAPERGTVVRNALSGFRTFLTGPSPAATVEALNRIAAPPDGPNFQDAFGRSDRKDYAGLPTLPPSSEGVGGAYPLEIPSPDGSIPGGTIRKDVGAFEVPR